MPGRAIFALKAPNIPILGKSEFRKFPVGNEFCNQIAEGIL